MKNRTNWLSVALGATVVILLVALAVPARAQDGGPENDDDEQVDSPVTLALITNDTVQVQGRLTDSGGSPLNGYVTIIGSIYDVSSGGTARCTDSDTVLATQGLFNLVLDYCIAADFNGDQLFLGIKVGADAEMTPRQEIHAVPYAWGLRPGAIIKGDDSYVFVPGSALVKNLNTDTTRWDIQANGAALIYRGAAAGDKTLYFPISLPGVLYGQSVTLKEVTVYYKSTANSYISYIDLNLQTDADSWLSIIDDDTNRTSTTATSFSIPLTTNNVLSNSQGIVALYMYLTFANDTEPVEIGGIRLRLGHQ